MVTYTLSIYNRISTLPQNTCLVSLLFVNLYRWAQYEQYMSCASIIFTSTIPLYVQVSLIAVPSLRCSIFYCCSCSLPFSLYVELKCMQDCVPDVKLLKCKLSEDTTLVSILMVTMEL